MDDKNKVYYNNKKIKVLIVVILLIFIMIVFIVKFSYELKNKKAIANYLNEKYGDNFTVIKSGNVSNILGLMTGEWNKYAIVKCDSYDNLIYVMCSPNIGEKDDKIYIDGKLHAIREEYAEIVFENQIENELEKKINNEFFLKCEVQFSNYYINNDEYKKGLKYCLEDKSIYSHVTIYAIARDESQMSEIRSVIEDYCSEYNAHRQNLYFAIAPSIDEKTIMEHYDENFDSHLKMCDEIYKIDYTLLKRDEGITRRERLDKY